MRLRELISRSGILYNFKSVTLYLFNVVAIFNQDVPLFVFTSPTLSI